MAKKSSISTGTTTCYRLNRPVTFPTIADACRAFGLKPVRRAGARFANAVPSNPNLKNVTLWFPQEQNIKWSNSRNGHRIIEVPKDPGKNCKQILKYLIKPEIRITFMKRKGGKGYEYVGVYRLDKPAILHHEKCIWKRVISNIHSDYREIIHHLSKNNLYLK